MYAALGVCPSIPRYIKEPPAAVQIAATVAAVPALRRKASMSAAQVAMRASWSPAHLVSKGQPPAPSGQLQWITAVLLAGQLGMEQLGELLGRGGMAFHR